MHPCTYRQLHAVACLEGGARRFLEHLEHVEGRLDAALGIVFMRRWIAEVNQYAVAEILRHVTAVGQHGGHHDRLVGEDDLPEFLWVEARGQGGRVRQVEEQDGQVTALGERFFTGVGRRGGVSGPVPAAPDQYPAALVVGDLPGMDQFVADILDPLVIEVVAPFESPVGRPLLGAQALGDLAQDFIKVFGHGALFTVP